MQVWNAWQTSAPLCPQLHLFSTVDALIPVEEAYAFQKAQVRGASMTKVATDQGANRRLGVRCYSLHRLGYFESENVALRRLHGELQFTADSGQTRHTVNTIGGILRSTKQLYKHS